MAKWDEAYELIASTAKALAAYSEDAREMVIGAIAEEASRIADKAEAAGEEPKKVALKSKQQRRKRSDAGKSRGPRKKGKESPISDEDAQDSHAQREIPL